MKKFLTMVVEVTTTHKYFIVQMGSVIVNCLIVENSPCSSVKQKVKDLELFRLQK